MDPTLPVAPPADPAAQAPMLAAVTSGVAKAAGDEEQKRVEKAEEDAVKALWKDYEQARKFDKEARAQYGIDRRYAAGTANLDWAVSANLIGAFIDILVSFLYARNPDVSAKKAARIDNTGTQQEDDFAKTVELVISSLWKSPTARMKETIRQQIRSVLTTGVGWLKVILVSNGTNIPQMRTQLNDLRENQALLAQLSAQLASDPADDLSEALGSDPGDDASENSTSGAYLPAADPLNPSPTPMAPPRTAVFKGEELTLEQINSKTLEMNELQESLQKKMEVALRKALAIDFVSSEDIQVSLDVRSVTDYVNSGWVANQIFRPTNKITALFPEINDEDVKKATKYYQRANRELSNLSDRVSLTGMADSNEQADESEQYISAQSKGGIQSSEQGIPFARIVELWNRETNHVHTMVDGIDKWAKQPYQPDYASTRFYPYFCLSFYPVDGVRHPQSLAWRLMKLQDEYHSVRSSLRLTRKRAAPGTLFNATGLDPVEARKIEQSTHQEFIGLKPTNPDQRLGDLFAEKPVSVGDMRLYDVQPITADMEKISGVQEALQSSVTTEKTATEANIQQSGFSARTTADRDCVETMLTDMAHYTTELAIQGLTTDDATRIAGAKAFWPFGMAIEDLLTMVEITIEAGTTGKPKSDGDKAAWGTLLPTLQANIMQIHQAQIMGDLPLANALTELVKETMHRMGDESDVSRFIPQIPPPAPPAPPVPGAPVPGAAPGAPGAVAPGAGVPADGAVPQDAGALPPPVAAGFSTAVGVPDAAGYDAMVAAAMSQQMPGTM